MEQPLIDQVTNLIGGCSETWSIETLKAGRRGNLPPGLHSDQPKRENTRAALTPPKPKALDNT